MCLTSSHRQGVSYIIPSFLLHRIAQNGTPAQRQAAIEALNLDVTVRAFRAQTVTQAQPALAPSTTPVGVKQRTIFDGEQARNLPGKLVRGEGQNKTTDDAVNEAYDGFGATYDFYWNVFKRNSIDDKGTPLLATVHYGQNYAQALWQGERVLFGDGDNDLFNRYTGSLDVIAHELTHGVIASHVALSDFFQAGALNEHIADVFGSLVKQWTLKQTADQADWLLGEGLFTTKVQGKALRSMAAPGTAFDDPVLGKDPQPAHMNDVVRTDDDNGGVHINNGIPNHAFYLLAKNLGGNAWEKAGRIWYETLRDPHMRPTMGFATFAKRTLVSAGQLFGAKSAEQQAVQDCWKQVGIVLK